MFFQLFGSANTGALTGSPRAGDYFAMIGQRKHESISTIPIYKMDFNWLGLPRKGYGFSNDAKATLSPPSFMAASFGYSGGGSLTVLIDIFYW